MKIRMSRSRQGWWFDSIRRDMDILLPNRVAREIALEQQAKAVEAAKAAHAKILADKTAYLISRGIDQLENQEDRRRLASVCAKMIDGDRGIRFEECAANFTMAEVARIFSDALLGPGDHWETKT